MLSGKSPHNYISYLSSQLLVGGGVSWTHASIPLHPPTSTSAFVSKCRQPSHYASATCYLTTDTRLKGRREETQMETSPQQDQNGTTPDFLRIRESQNCLSPTLTIIAIFFLVDSQHYKPLVSIIKHRKQMNN